MRDGTGYRLPGPVHLGWWAALAMIASILLHIGVFILLDRMKIALTFEQARELTTGNVNVRRVEVSPVDEPQATPPEDPIKPPDHSADLLEEVDLLAALPKDQKIDIKPDVKDPEYALSMQKPAAAGDPTAVAKEAAAGLDFETDLPEFGRTPEQLKPAAIGQLTVDPGAVHTDDDAMGKFTDDLVKRGAHGKVDQGAMDGVTSLDNLLDLPPNVLVGKKTMLPSDLLFEFNSSELRESAKVGLLKLALLIDRNPNLYCWIEGHTDLVGGDDFNLNLSIRRAEAVKSYLVKSLRMNEDKIITRGFGRYQPLITTGNADQQAPNRRVEIRMRNTPPDKDQIRISPPKATTIPEPPKPSPPKATAVPEPTPPKAILVKPKRALPVEDVEPSPPPLRALPADGMPPLPAAPKAEPVDEPTP